MQCLKDFLQTNCQIGDGINREVGRVLRICFSFGFDMNEKQNETHSKKLGGAKQL